MNKKVSLKDIAAAVGVSTALVSYVLNNKKEGRINKSVAEKIKAAALAMNYRTNQIARSLKTNKTNTIGLILADISNPFSAALARVIEDEADKYNYTVIFGSSDENPEKYKKILDALVNRQADGLILSPPEHAEPQINDLRQQQIPFVLIDRYFPGIETNYVVLDNYKAAFEATQHLIDCGHKRTGMINYASSLFHLAERTRGYLSALTKNKIASTPGYLQQVHTIALKEETEKAVDNLLQHEIPAGAILFGSNVIAMHAVKYINQQRYTVPRDVALACFDETDAFDLFYAPLTCIKQPIKEMGQLAVKMLLENIDNNSTKIKQVSLDGELIVRQSTVI
ncbi:MAG TPA: substrate-binding domain-containing protein [Chitinophagaceae bacterium]|nr:substrate-binding domain-containing protein [Chitinophagaceae bacterium]